MNEPNWQNRLALRFREAPEPSLGHSLYPGIRARIAGRRDSISTPIRFAGGLVMAAGILVGVFLGDEWLPTGTAASTTEEEYAALLSYGEDETLDTAFLNSFTEEVRR